MKAYLFLTPIFLALAILVAAPVHSQVYAVDWWAFAWGGEIQSGGEYTLSGSGGQPEPGALTGGNYTLTAGFLVVETQSYLYLPLIIRD